MGQYSQYSDYDICCEVWGSNIGRSNRNISSPKHPDQLQHPHSLQLNENQNFFSGSKEARADSLNTHIHIEPSLKISAAIPPLNLSHSMAHIGKLYFTFNTNYVHIFQEVTYFLSYKGSFPYII